MLHVSRFESHRWRFNHSVIAFALFSLFKVKPKSIAISDVSVIICRDDFSFRNQQFFILIIFYNSHESVWCFWSHLGIKTAQIMYLQCRFHTSGFKLRTVPKAKSSRNDCSPFSNIQAAHHHFWEPLIYSSLRHTHWVI